MSKCKIGVIKITLMLVLYMQDFVKTKIPNRDFKAGCCGMSDINSPLHDLQ